MPASPEDLLARLDTLGIPWVKTEHPPVFTVAESEGLYQQIPGVHCKNLFFKDAKGQIWLVVCPHDRVLDLKALPKIIGAGRLTFGKAELLLEILGVLPGAVTPFGLMNDTSQRVRVVLDAWMIEQAAVNYHPLVNTATLTVSGGDLVRFVLACGHQPVVIDLR